MASVAMAQDAAKAKRASLLWESPLFNFIRKFGVVSHGKIGIKTPDNFILTLLLVRMQGQVQVKLVLELVLAFEPELFQVRA